MVDMVMSRPEAHVGGRTGCTMACVDIRDARDHTGPPTPGRHLSCSTWSCPGSKDRSAADDRICPFSASRLLVQFGPSADDILPQVLGDRLARAVGLSAHAGRSTPGSVVSVGIAVPRDAGDASDVARRALAAARVARSGPGDPVSTVVTQSGAMVTVDRLAESRTTRRASRTHQILHRRTRYRPDLGWPRSDSAISSGAGSGASGMVRTGSAQVANTVLVVDPLAPESARAGFATLSAASTVESLGCRVGTATPSPDDPLTLTLGDATVDLVVLVLDGGRPAQSPTWTSGIWGTPARLAASYGASGVPVLAVSAGLGAGALAACVAQGAMPVFGLDDLTDAIRSVERYTVEEVRELCELGFGAQFQALVGLTASERRVLFYLTEGWSAQEIAEELVVSLTTIRSHIGSVLRKLGVKSQLAAVAIANNRAPQHLGASEAS